MRIIQSEYCPYCTQNHYKIKIGKYITMRYGCKFEVIL